MSASKAILRCRPRPIIPLLAQTDKLHFKSSTDDLEIPELLTNTGRVNVEEVFVEVLRELDNLQLYAPSTCQILCFHIV